jgi:RNA polymerase sigma-70 factor, ECF subfamily
VTHTSVSPNSDARVRPTMADCRPEMSHRRLRSARPTTVDLLTETRRTAPQTEPEPHQVRRFEEMFQAYRKKFLWTAGAILRNKEDAEDAVQNALISALRNLRNFEGRSALTTWFTRVVMNAALMIRRKRQRSSFEQWPEFESTGQPQWTETVPASDPDPEMMYAEEETLRHINRILRAMKPIHREAVELIYYREMSIREASEATGISASALKARVYRARQEFAKSFSAAPASKAKRAQTHARERLVIPE